MDTTQTAPAVAPIVATSPVVDRWFVRCADCLSVMAVDVERPPTCALPAYYERACRETQQRIRADVGRSRDRHAEGLLGKALCGLCNGKIEVMGRVKADRPTWMVRESYEKCVCDARCQSAKGPSCDCPCGGKNHGTSVTVTVEVIDSTPRVSTPDKSAAKKRADEYRAEIARVQQTHPGRLARLNAEGTYLPRSEWEVAESYRRAVSHARSLRTHKGRMGALAKITEEGVSY